MNSLLTSTNTHVLAPYWAAVAAIRIPLSSCNRAADLLIDWFGPEDLKTVVGGERWWQVRGLDEIDSEWVAEKENLNNDSLYTDKDDALSQEEKLIRRMEHLEAVMVCP